MGSPGLESRTEGQELIVQPLGPWLLAHSAEMSRMVALTSPASCNSVMVSMAGLTALDTAGALILYHLTRRLVESGLRVTIAEVQPSHSFLMKTVADTFDEKGPLPPPRTVLPILAFLDLIGRNVLTTGQSFLRLANLLGLVTRAFLLGLLAPTRFRPKSIAAHVVAVGISSLPILGLLSFLIGLVIAFQGARQLNRFGADALTINLLGVIVLRELGILLTAILLAGRTGSAFAAEIGSMVNSQEIDAMRVMGFDPIQFLVLPRVIALVLCMPLLTFYADVMALAGGFVMTFFWLDISLLSFLRQLHNAFDGQALFLIGVVKAPVFALLIGAVGCVNGLYVTGSAQEVGRAATRAVVESLFLVILFDAIFAVSFSLLRL